ncbi:MAG TPA: extracellular solute-binding protein [Acidimicrobiales bacterium]|nr:extracellular solute-binding protein [Acidimicrobiales bacterium]
MKRLLKVLSVSLVSLLVVAAFSFAGGSKEAAAMTSQGGRVDLQGKTIHMTILGIGGWIPSRLGVEMAPIFQKYAKEKYGYNAEFSYQDAPFTSLYQKAATSLATHSQEFNIIISDSQWLGALSNAGWILKLNSLIEGNPTLSKTQWWDPIVQESYQSYPDYSNELWGLPQEGDVLVLYVRKDLVDNPTNQKNFKAQYGFDLPSTFEEYSHLTMDKYIDICKFFTRPADGLYGVAIQYSKEYDYMTGSLYPFIWSSGGQIWDYKTNAVWGVLNTDSNAKALETDVSLLKYAPPGDVDYGIGQVLDAFTQGKVATAWQWAAEGSGMITPQLEGKVLVVPLPGFMVNGKFMQVSSLGGQPWVLNKFNDPAHMQVAKDFMAWWYLPQTQMEFVKQGGNSVVKDVLDSPGFDNIHPWLRAYKYELTTEHSRDFWHVPQYAQMLALQQEYFTGYASGAYHDAKSVLDYIAAQQQKILYDAGISKIPPPTNIANIVAH